MTDSIFIVFGWWVWAVLALFGAVLGFAAMALLSTRRPHWTGGRRLLAAALVPAGLILVGTAIGAGMVLVTSEAGDWSDLAVPALARLGATAAVVSGAAAFVTGLLARRLAQP